MVLKLFDTSVLVAALVKAHDMHEDAHPHLQDARNGDIQLAVSTHALAETFSTFTRLRLQPRITPTQAHRIIEEGVLPIADIVTLDTADYLHVIERMAKLKLTSGAVYNALHVRAAEKIAADELLTCNGSDFRRMPPQPPTKLVVL